MKKAVIIMLFGLGLSAQAQSYEKVTEINIRPITLLQGVINAGLEIRTSKHASVLFDVGAGNNLYMDNAFQFTVLIGGRVYLGQEMEGVYGTFRQRFRWSDEYSGNTNFMFGKKFVILDKITASVEVGVGRQSQFDSEFPLILPTWAVTLGYRIDQSK